MDGEKRYGKSAVQYSRNGKLEEDGGRNINKSREEGGGVKIRKERRKKGTIEHEHF